MPALGDPPTPSTWHENRSTTGGNAQVSYLPLPAGAVNGGAANGCIPGSGGPRPGGRRAEEMRPCHLVVGAVPNAGGSAYIEQGRTKIAAAVYGPRPKMGERASQAVADGVLFVDLQFAPFSLLSVSKEENEKRGVLYNSILQRALESVVRLDLYGKLFFDVTLLVLEDDGSVLTAALAAASLALKDAAVEMLDLAVGATVHHARFPGREEGALLLDCEGAELRTMPEDSAVLHLGLCPSLGKCCMLHSVGPLPAAPFEQMVLLAKDTAEAVGAEVRRCVDVRAVKKIRRTPAEGTPPGGPAADGGGGEEAAAADANAAV